MQSERDRLDERLEALKSRVAEKKLEVARSGAPSGDTAGFGLALKLGSEFVAGVLVGAAIGWAIDHFAGTGPWGLIVFLMMGFAAGVVNVVRAANAVTSEASGRPTGVDRSGKNREDSRCV